MLTWILLILLLAALVVLGTWLWGRIFGRGEILEPVDNRDQIEANRLAVARGAMRDVQFEIVPRGYRPEQVDDVIAHLEWQLAQERSNRGAEKV